MNTIVFYDLYRYGGLEGYKGLLRGLKFPGFKYMLLHRLYNSEHKTPIFKLFLRLLARKYSHKYGFQIPFSTKIGAGFYIGHFGTIVINGDSIIGENCNIAHGVTIGQQNRGINKGCPTIGNNVWIGTGSVIVGKITIGNNVLIAPNSFVNIDVPNNCIAIGNPVKLIFKEDSTLSYINNTIEQIR